MTDLESFLKTYFEIADPVVLQKLSALFKKQTLKKGDHFFKAGAYWNKLCFIRSGVLRVYALADDKEVTQWIATQGAFGTDFSSFLFDHPSRWNMQALVDTELYVIAKGDYDAIGMIVPHWDKLERNFIVKCLAFLENRVFGFLSMSAEERYHSFLKTNPEVFDQAPSQYIASMLGMTPETFSRIKNSRIS